MTFMKKVFILLTFNNQKLFCFVNKRSTPRFFFYLKKLNIVRNENEQYFKN